MAVKFQLPVVAVLLGLGCLSAQAIEDDGSRLAIALRQHYKLATSKLDTDGRLTFEPGTRLTVRKEGIVSYLTTDTSIATLCPSRIEGGVIHSQSDLACTKLAPAEKQNLKVSETVCVTAIDVNSVADKLSMVLVSCDPYNAVPKSKATRAVVLFIFPKGTLGKATPAKIEDIIGQTFSEGHSDATVMPTSGADAVKVKEPAAEQSAEADDRTKDKDPGSERPPSTVDPPPASSDAAATKGAQANDEDNISQVGKGQTMQQVTALLGLPLSITDLHDRVLFLYPKWKVFFVDGKVTEVHQIGS